jgi:predicted transcriptional regulator
MKTTLAAEVDESVLVKLEKLAKREHRPVEKVVQDALAGYLRKEQEERLEALEQFLKPSIPAGKRHLQRALGADFYEQ